MPTARTALVPVLLVTALAAGCGSPADSPAPAPSVTVATVTLPPLESPTAGTTAASTAPATSRPAVDKEITVTIAQRKVTPPTGRVEVAKGKLVRITATSDITDELHIHGYDKTLVLPSGMPASIDLRVDKTGLFEVETHGSHLVLFQLVVR